MKALKVFLIVLVVFLSADLTQINAQNVIHWPDFSWTGKLPIDCPESNIKFLSGTLYQDFVIRVDENGNWLKINAQYDKSEFFANTGEVFKVFGAVTVVFTEDFSFIETLVIHGDRCSKFIAKTLTRFKDGTLTKEMLTLHCVK